jgi:Zn-dependent protease
MSSPDLTASFSRFAVAFAPALLGIILHEVAHGLAADRLGDPTARLMGRLSLNPKSHIDPAGLFVFLLTGLFGPFVFGWARPVPVNPRFFRNPSKDMMLVSLAGPLTNITLAFIFAALLRLVAEIFPEAFWPEHPCRFLPRALQAGIVINFGLAWLNLLPVPPLDGSRIVTWLLPPDLALRFNRLERYGFLVLILLLAAGALNAVLGPLVFGSAEFALNCVGLR